MSKNEFKATADSSGFLLFLAKVTTSTLDSAKVISFNPSRIAPGINGKKRGRGRTLLLTGEHVQLVFGN